MDTEAASPMKDLASRGAEVIETRSIRVPTVDDRRTWKYKHEHLQERLERLQAKFDGYRQAVQDIFGQKGVEVEPKQGIE